jgi:hypothetical protein
MSALAAEMPVKPKTAATIEIRRKISAHFSNDMVQILLSESPFKEIPSAGSRGVTASGRFGSSGAQSHCGCRSTAYGAAATGMLWWARW